MLQGPIRLSKNTKNGNAAFRWKELLEAKVEVNKKENKAAEKLKSRYQMEADRKQSGRAVVCTEAEVPWSSRNNRRRRREEEVSSPSSNNASVQKKESLIMIHEEGEKRFS